MDLISFFASMLPHFSKKTAIKELGLPNKSGVAMMNTKKPKGIRKATVTLVSSSKSPYEQGELGSSSPEITIKADYSEEDEEHQEDEDQIDSEQDMDYTEEDQLDIKPPPVPVKKKDKHKHKRKEEKKKDKTKSKHRDEDKDRHREVRPREREAPREHREERGRGVPDRYSQDAKTYDRKRSNLDRERELKEKLIREQEKREKSRLERERLERLEREKNRERRIREDRDRREQEKRRKKEQERKLQIQKKQREEERQRKQKAKMEHTSRGRSRSRERRNDSRSVKSRLGPRPSDRGRDYRSPDVRKSESKSYSPERESEVSRIKDGLPDTAQSPSEEEEESEDSESDSGSAVTESSSPSEESSGEEEQKEEEEEMETSDDKKHLAKSKFDDHSDNESDTGSAGLDAHQDQDGFLQDTPPLSPIELKPDLPPYFPAIQGCRNVEEFECLNRIEEGTYGVVYRSRDKKTEEIVALKRLKMEKEKEGFPITSLREINTLLKAQHTNIVTVREIVVGSNMDKIYIVMDYVEHDLKSLIETMKQPFLIGEVKTLLKQLLRGVQHLHDNWIIHRDLKTSNLLLSHKGILKIGDFGLAREYGEPLKRYTPIVVTLWYRAPELLLGTKEYTTPIDMWSVGCIMAEFLTRKAIWQGKSELDQLEKIFRDLGTPTERIWPGVSELPGMKKCTFTEHPYNTLRNKFGQYLSDSGFTLLNKFLTYSPSRRITAAEAFKSEFFEEAPLPVDPSMFPTWPAKSEQSRKHASSPKPPSGGKAYSKLLEDGDDVIAGFHLTNAAKGVSATGPGFSLKF